MPFDTFEWIRRVKAVEREHTAMRFATDRLLGLVRQDSTALTGELKVKDIQTASERLEGTYIIRLFAEFETSLRMFWVSRGRKTRPSISVLLGKVGATCHVSDGWIQKAHDVREYRNFLVHEREEDIEPIQILQAQKHLCRFLSRLPGK